VKALVDRIAAWDLALFQAVNGAGTEALDGFFRLLSSRAFGLGVLALVAAALLARRRGAAVGAVLVLIAAVAVTDLLGARVIKPHFGRVRPCDALPPGSFRAVVAVGRSASMPSLHAADYFAGALVVFREWRALGAASYVLAALVGLSRVYVGVHWPSDVVAGALVGTAVAAALLAGRGRLAPRVSSRRPTG
jgi:undecaprenyl-diphosphatase